MTQHNLPQFTSADAVVNYIESLLTRLSSCPSRKRWDVMDDYLNLLLMTYRAIPRHRYWKQVYGVTSAEEAPYNKVIIQEIRMSYGDEYQLLKDAVSVFVVAGDRCGMYPDGILVTSTNFNWDIIGQIYEQFGLASTNRGMFFTPWDACLLTAELARKDVSLGPERKMPDYEAVHQLAQYVSATPAEIQNLLIAGVETQELMGLLHQAYKNGFEPIRDYDPCAGSGRLLLAKASLHTPLAEALGLYRYYMQDIDFRACMMAEINQIKYGLGGWKAFSDVVSASGFYETSRWMKYESIENYSGTMSLTVDDAAWVRSAISA